MLYPMKTLPVFQDYIWGGTRLRETYGKDIGNRAAESWEVSCLDLNPCKVANGEFAGLLLKDVISEKRDLIMGKNGAHYQEFPLLVKLLDANQKLSVQVHPYGEHGKTEMWYIIDAKPGAKIGYGFSRDVTKDEVRAAAKNGTMESLIHYVDVKPGDAFFIKGGTVHCLCEGLLVAEVQQSSNTTYRLYDYNRRDAAGNLRELHVEEALSVAELSGVSDKDLQKPVIKTEGDVQISTLADCPYFITMKYVCPTRYQISMNGKTFETITFVKGSGEILYSGGSVAFRAGDSFLIPACLCMYDVLGDCEFLRSMLP